MNKYTYLIAFLLLIINVNCKKKKTVCNNPSNIECANYDPCYGKTKTNASFVIEEDLGPNYGMRDNPQGLDWTYFDAGDTISVGFVYFEPIDTTALSYEWHIGSKVYSDLRLELQVDTDIIGQHVPVTLIIHKNPAVACFPSDDGYETCYRTIYIVRKESSIINGRWLGYNTDNPNDTFTVTFEVNPNCCVAPDFKTKNIWFKNLPKGHSGTNYPGQCNIPFFSFRQGNFYFESTDVKLTYEHISVGVHVWVSRDNNSITIDYNYSDYDQKTLKYLKINYKTFKGIRVM